MTVQKPFFQCSGELGHSNQDFVCSIAKLKQNLAPKESKNLI